MGALAAGTKEFKRPPEHLARTARDYSTAIHAGRKDRAVHPAGYPVITGDGVKGRRKGKKKSEAEAPAGGVGAAKAGTSAGSRPADAGMPGRAYFSVFTKSATALASSAERPLKGLLCGAFLALLPLVSMSTIWSAGTLVPLSEGPILPSPPGP